MSEKSDQWFVYMIVCSDQSLYTGIAKDIEKRFDQHLNKKGAKYFYGRQPVKVVYQESFRSRGQATSRELEIKKMTAIQKSKLIKASG